MCSFCSSILYIWLFASFSVLFAPKITRFRQKIWQLISLPGSLYCCHIVRKAFAFAPLRTSVQHTKVEGQILTSATLSDVPWQMVQLHIEGLHCICAQFYCCQNERVDCTRANHLHTDCSPPLSSFAPVWAFVTCICQAFVVSFVKEAVPFQK